MTNLTEDPPVVERSRSLTLHLRTLHNRSISAKKPTTKSPRGNRRNDYRVPSHSRTLECRSRRIVTRCPLPGGNRISPIAIITLIFRRDSFSLVRSRAAELRSCPPPPLAPSLRLLRFVFSFVNNAAQRGPTYPDFLSAAFFSFLPLHALLFLPTPFLASFPLSPSGTPFPSTPNARTRACILHVHACTIGNGVGKASHAILPI